MTLDQAEDKDPLANNQKQKKAFVESGKKCSASGEWEAEGPISTIVYVSKGELMPMYCGKKVKWTLLRNG